MNDHTLRRRIVAVVAGLAVAGTISVVAPAAATARPVGKAPASTVLVHDKTAKGGGAAVANDWAW